MAVRGCGAPSDRYSVRVEYRRDVARVRAAPYPAGDILAYLAEHGGCAVLSSDSHRADTLGFGFDMAARAAARAGLPLLRHVRDIVWEQGKDDAEA